MDTLILDSMVDSGVPGREENVETVTTRQEHTSEILTCPLGCVGVRSCTYLREPSLFSLHPSYLPMASKFCHCSCQCEKDFSTTVKNEVLSLISFYGHQRDPAFSNSVEHPSVQEMIQCATECYWNLKVEQLRMKLSSQKESQQVFVPSKDDTRILPPCFHRTLRGIKAIASQMRLVEDNEIKRMLDEVDRREEEEEEEKIKTLEESMK
jgi:hypothetical protein